MPIRTLGFALLSYLIGPSQSCNLGMGATTSLALLAAALSAACMSGSLTGYEQPPVYTSLPGLEFAVAPGASARVDFEVAERGSLLATIDWTDPENNLVAVITGRGCQSIDDALAGRCRTAEGYGPTSTCPVKPRVVVHSNYAPVALRLWIANTGATAESGTVAMTHCREAPNCGLSCGECVRRQSCAP